MRQFTLDCFIISSAMELCFHMIGPFCHFLIKKNTGQLIAERYIFVERYENHNSDFDVPCISHGPFVNRNRKGKN